MTGIKLTAARRSQLLEELLKQNSSAWDKNPQSWAETGIRMLAQGLNQWNMNKLSTEQAATEKVQGANEAAALAEALGQQPKSVFGTDLPGQQAPGSMRQHLMTQNPKSPYGPMLAGFEMKQKLEDKEYKKRLQLEQAKSGIKVDAVNFGDANGEPTGTYIKGSPEYFAAVRDPNQFLLGNVAQTQTQVTGTPEDFRSDNQKGKLQVEINDQVGAVNAFGSQAERLLNIVRETEGANTLTAALANIGNRIKNEAKAFARTSGVEFESGTDVFNTNKFEEAFSAVGLAGANARVKNGYLALAIQKAIASGLGSGRALSDKDIESQLVTLGKFQSDPSIIARVFQDSFDSVSDNVTYKAEAQGLDLPEIKRFDFNVNDPVDDFLKKLRERRGN